MRPVVDHRLSADCRMVRAGYRQWSAALGMQIRRDHPRVVVEPPRVHAGVHMVGSQMSPDVQMGEVPGGTAPAQDADLLTLLDPAAQLEMRGDRVEVVVFPDQTGLIDDVDEDRVRQQADDLARDAGDHLLAPFETGEVDSVRVVEDSAFRIAVHVSQVHRLVVTLHTV